MCLFIALFWAARLIVQFVVFNARPYLKTAFLKAGYHGLTVVFVYHAFVFNVAAVVVVDVECESSWIGKWPSRWAHVTDE